MDMYVLPIPKHYTYDWILKKHYAKRLPSISYAYGLYDIKQLQGVCTYGKPASPFLCNGVCGDDNSFRVFELNRLVVNDGINNGASYLIAQTLKMLPDGLIIVSYADTGMGHIGKVYQATNWIYTGITKERTDIGIDDNTHARHYDKNIDKKNNRKVRTAKHRYIYFTGTKRDKKELRKMLRYDEQNYPEGTSKKYDAGGYVDTQLILFNKEGGQP